MIKRHKLNSEVILLFGDVVCIALGVAAAVFIHFEQLELLITSYKSVTVLSCATMVTLFYISDLYDHRQDPRDIHTTLLILLNVVLGTTMVAIVFYFSSRWFIGRRVFVLIDLVAPVFVIAWRISWFHFHRSVTKPRRIGFLGGERALEEVTRLAMGHRFEVIPLEIGDADPANLMNSGGVHTRIDSSSDLEKSLSYLGLDAIILAPQSRPNWELIRSLIKARFSGIAVFDMADFVQSVSGKLPIEHMEGAWFLSATGFRLFESRIALRAKRLSDLVLVLFLAMLSLPLLPLIALGIRLSSRGPVFYRQEREGLNGQRFTLLKFRTMVVDSESESPVWASQRDSRVFPFGRFLRLFHLDEIPQVFNIIKGEMSFVGPRPERPAFVEELKQRVPFYDLRDAVLPGLTGWAQVNYPYGSSVDDALEKLKYDLYYIQNVSLLLDLQIVLKTIRIVLTRKGSR